MHMICGKAFLKRIHIVILCLIAVLIGTNTINAADLRKEKPKANEGVMNLSDWDFSAYGNVQLDGQWEFYWKQFLNPSDFTGPAQAGKVLVDLPSEWNSYRIDGERIGEYGYATYRLVVETKDTGSQLALSIPYILSAHKLWVNDELVSQDGRVAANEKESEISYYSKVVPISPRNGPIEIVFWVSNYGHVAGGMPNPISMGSYARLSDGYNVSVIMEILIFGVLFVSGLFFVFIFTLRGRNRESVYFGLFCIALSLRPLVIDNCILGVLLRSIPHEFFVRMEFLSLFAGTAMYSGFFSALFPRTIHKRFRNVVFGICALEAASTVIMRFHSIMLANIPYLAISAITLAYILVALFVEALKKKLYALTILVSNIVLFVFSLNDMLYAAGISGYGRNFYIVGIILMILIQASVVLRRFESLSKQIVDARLEFLQAQIQPHFLFNTLNTVMGFCISDPHKAYDLLDDFGGYLRGKFDFRSIDEAVMLSAEMDMVMSYLSIEKARFGNKLEFGIKMEEDAEFAIQPLTIQPLVENAVKHGIGRKLSGGRVEICVERTDAGYAVSVEDDGVGMTAEEVAGILKVEGKSRGIGLKNVDERLRLNYGKGLKIESEPGKGTRVSFEVPLAQKQGG